VSEFFFKTRSLLPFLNLYFMQRKTPRLQGKTILLMAAALFIFAIAFILYQSVWKKPVLTTHGLVKPERIFREHSAPLWAVQFSPDGNFIASGSIDSTVKIWRREDGRVVQNLKQPMGITALAYSPDGKTIATGSYDATVRLWQVESGLLLKILQGHAGTVWSVAFSPDGKTIASCGEDKTVRLWNNQTGALVNTIKAHGLNVWKVRFTPAGDHLVSSSFDRTIKVWNVADGSLLKTLEGHTEAVVGLAISPDGKLLASGSDDKTIRIWNLATGQSIKTLENGDGHVYTVAFSPDGKRLISGSRDKDNVGEIFQNFFGDSEASKGISMRLWDVATGELLESLAGHANDVMDVCYSPDGNWIASASEDKTVCLWKTTTAD